MASVRPLTDLTVADLWREVKDPATLWGDVSRETLDTVKHLLENRMLEELAEQLKAHWYARTAYRRGYRNGHYIRHLTTTWGTIPNLEIPRPRTGSFTSTVLERYQRRMPQVDELVRRVFLGRSYHAAGRALQQWRQAWERTAPNAVACVLRDWEALLAFHGVPQSDWRRVRTTAQRVGGAPPFSYQIPTPSSALFAKSAGAPAR